MQAVLYIAAATIMILSVWTRIPAMLGWACFVLALGWPVILALLS